MVTGVVVGAMLPLFDEPPSGSGGHAANMNVQSTITTRTNPRGALRVNRCCATINPQYFSITLDARLRNAGCPRCPRANETHGEAAGSHRTVIVSPGSAGVWTGSRRACVACSKL